MKLSLAAAFVWGKSYAGTFVPRSIAPFGSAVALAGDFCGTVNFGGGPLSSVKSCADGDRDIFSTQLSAADGAHLFSMRAGGTALDLGYGVAPLADGRTIVAGAFQGFAEFGGQGLTSNGGYDLVVLGLAPLQ